MKRQMLPGMQSPTTSLALKLNRAEGKAYSGVSHGIPLIEDLVLRSEPERGVIADLVAKASARCASWQAALLRRGIPCEAYPRGSLLSGLYGGPKPQGHSVNQACPWNLFDSIIEIDIRIDLPSNVCPHDPKIKKILEEETGGIADQDIEVVTWICPQKLIHIYIYEEFGVRFGIEWELAFFQGKGIDITSYWPRVFTDEEIKLQRADRFYLREQGRGFNDVLQVLKEQQAQECRWRIIAGYSLAELARGIKPEIKHFSKLLSPFLEPVPDELRPLVSSWLEGKRGSIGLDRPDPTVSVKLEAPSHLAQELNRLVPAKLAMPPAWVDEAVSLQNSLCLRNAINKLCP